MYPLPFVLRCVILIARLFHIIIMTFMMAFFNPPASWSHITKNRYYNLNLYQGEQTNCRTNCLPRLMRVCCSSLPPFLGEVRLGMCAGIILYLVSAWHYLTSSSPRSLDFWSADCAGCELRARVRSGGVMKRFNTSAHFLLVSASVLLHQLSHLRGALTLNPRSGAFFNRFKIMWYHSIGRMMK